MRNIIVPLWHGPWNSLPFNIEEKNNMRLYDTASVMKWHSADRNGRKKTEVFHLVFTTSCANTFSLGTAGPSELSMPYPPASWLLAKSVMFSFIQCTVDLSMPTFIWGSSVQCQLYWIVWHSRRESLKANDYSYQATAPGSLLGSWNHKLSSHQSEIAFKVTEGFARIPHFVLHGEKCGLV